jgi:Protein kinase domain
MTTTPIIPPRLSATMDSTAAIDAGERVIAEQLQAALAPSFVLIRRIGAGGMGIVYLARDPALKRPVAVKLLSPDRAADPQARARFEREAEAVAAISHPNVVAVHSVGELPSGVPYIVMQYIEGPSIADRLRDEGPLDLATAKQIMGQVASALEAAHRKGIIHRDIKAANILWDEASGRALVSDFGIAAIRESDIRDQNPIHLTQTGTLIGTPRYMSPEQLLAEPVTEKTDIYSLGLLGYEMLAGEGPYQVTSPHAIIAAHLRDVPRPISVMRPDADAEIESLLKACLEKDPHSRPTAGDIARRLAHASSVLLEWPPPGLEPLHGALERPLSLLLNGSFAIAAPLVVAATAGRSSALRLGWPQVLALPTIAAVGAVAVAIASVMCLKLLRLAVRAARAGYGWGTIAEVLVDVRHDTGALICGEREYAGLGPDERNTLRRGRVLQSGLRLGAAAWSFIGFFVALPLAARGLGPAALGFSTLGISAAMLIAAGLLGRRETSRLRGIRAKAEKTRGPLERLSHLVDTWKDSFETAAGEMGIRQGRFGRVGRRVAGIVGAAVIVGLGALSAYGLTMFSVLGEVREQVAVPNFSLLQQRQARIRRLAFLRPAVDPSITPLRAGQAMHSIGRAGVTSVEMFGHMMSPSPLESPVAFPIGALPDIPASDQKGPFAKTWFEGGAIEAAKRGLTSEQRKYLEKYASAPGSSEFTMLAHARAIDYFDAAIVHPLPAGTSLSTIPVPRLGRLKVEAYYSVARAALALDAGHPDRAEQVLREDVGVGFAMLDSPTLFENLIGVVIANIGRNNLVSLYEVTGRSAEASAISPISDPVFEEASGEIGFGRMRPADRAAFIQAIIRDTLSIRALRWSMTLFGLANQPCSDLRQVLFGPDSLHLARLAEARRALVHQPGEDALMRLAEGAVETPVNVRFADVPSYPAYRTLREFARAVDHLSGSKRMEACLSRSVGYDR